MDSKNDKAAEPARLNEPGMENRTPERPLDAREAMRAKEEGQKKRLGGPRKPLIRLDSDEGIQAFPLVGFGRAWLDFARL